MTKKFMFVCLGILALGIVVPATGDDGARQLVYGHEPAWSPCGDSIVFQGWSDEYDAWWLYKIPAAGGEPTLIYDELLYDISDYHQPAWSPDGSQIAFCTHREIRRIPTSGGTSVLVFDGGSGTSVQEPTWSPDGNSIAFASGTAGGMTRNIWVVPADGGSPSWITGNHAWYPAWSPDGSQIAFCSGFDEADIWVVPATGGTATQLTSGPAFDFSPTWSPDGTCIAYWSSQGDEENIWTIPVSGGTPAQATFEGGTLPSWSPDGSQIAFQANDYVWIIDAPKQCPVDQTSWGQIKSMHK